MTTARVIWGSQSLSVNPDGFRWQQSNGQVLEGPWNRVTSVMTFAASSSINGVHVGTWQHLGMAFDSGEGFRFHSRDREAFDVAALSVQYAGPHIASRLAAQLDAGQTIQCGPLSLSKSAVGFKKKSWPLAQVAGHRTYQGHWMMDVGPKDAPKLVVQVQLNAVPNFFAFKALLDRLLPGSDYGEQAPDLGTMFRPSASSHDPRYPAGRTRLMILGGMVGVAALVGLGFLGVSMYQHHQYDQARLAGEARLARIMKAADDAPAVPAGQAFSCDKSVDSVYDLVFATRGPKGVDRPGLVHEDEAFALSSSGSSVVSPFDDSPFLVMGELRGVAGPPKGERVVTMAMKIVDTKSLKVVCSGELAGRFKEDSEYAASFAMQDLLLQAICKEDSTCDRAREKTKLVGVGAVAVEAKPVEPKKVSQGPAAPKKPLPVKKSTSKRGVEF